MQRSQTIIIAGMVLVLGFTAWVLADLLNQRFESGTVYPPYSTQRTDPLGAKALMEALDRLPNVECRQNFLRVEKLQGSQQEALFFLNITPSSWQDGRVIQGDFIKQFAATGGRVVISLASASTGWGQLEEDVRQRQLKEEQEEREKEEEKKKNQKSDEEAKEEADTDKQEDKKDTKKKRQEALFKTPDSLEKVLGISFEKGQFILTPRGGYELTVNENSELKDIALPEWYSKASIKLPDNDKASEEKTWEILATVNDKAMIIKRSIGLGSIVICTDSYFASNEALWKEPSAEFLYWLTGGKKTILFDETHLGTREQPGIMHLARKFRLHGFFVGGIVLFGLFVWQSTMSLVPSSETEDDTASSVSGHGATAGLVSLLKRGVPRRKLLQKSFETWEKNTAVLSPSMKTRIEQARQLIPDDKTKLPKGVAVKLYQQIRDILHQKRY